MRCGGAGGLVAEALRLRPGRMALALPDVRKTADLPSARVRELSPSEQHSIHLLTATPYCVGLDYLRIVTRDKAKQETKEMAPFQFFGSRSHVEQAQADI